MSLNKLVEVVENKIIELGIIFYKKKGVFLTETDVQSYMYSLLINDPYIQNFTPEFSISLNEEFSKSSLIHTNYPVNIGDDKNKKVDITIFNPDVTRNPELVIGIEIKFNRKEPTRKEKSNILEDINKVAAFEKGYIIWFNWDREIDDKHLKKAEENKKEYENVKFFYLDTYSEPVKTNIKIFSKIN
jgi:hypothetical protein